MKDLTRMVKFSPATLHYSIKERAQNIGMRGESPIPYHNIILELKFYFYRI